MAHTLTPLAALCAPIVACLVGCYAPQPMVVAPSVSDWRANRAAEPAVATAVASPSGWTADAMVARALAQNPALLGWSARVEAAAASVDAAGGFRDIEFRVTRAELSDLEEGNPLFDLSLRGRPPRPGDVASREDAAHLQVEELSAQRDDARRRLRAQVRGLHATLVFYNREATLLSAERALRVQHHELQRGRMEQGAANKLDVVLASLERAQLEDSLSALALRRLRAEGALRELLDLSPEQSMAPTGEPGGVAEELLGLTPMGREAWVGEGLKARASLRETAAVLGRARADAYRADSELWPWFGWVELSYELKDGSTPLSWGFAFAVDLPIFAWTGAKTQAADALIRQRVQEHDSVITQIAREVEGAFAAEYGARQRLDALRETLLSAVNEAAAAAATARPELVPAADQMLRLEVASLRAQRRQLEALRDWVDARLRLHASVGR